MLFSNCAIQRASENGFEMRQHAVLPRLLGNSDGLRAGDFGDFGAAVFCDHFMLQLCPFWRLVKCLVY